MPKAFLRNFLILIKPQTFLKTFLYPFKVIRKNRRMTTTALYNQNVPARNM